MIVLLQIEMEIFTQDISYQINDLTSNQNVYIIQHSLNKHTYKIDDVLIDSTWNHIKKLLCTILKPKKSPLWQF